MWKTAFKKIYLVHSYIPWPKWFRILLILSRKSKKVIFLIFISNEILQRIMSKFFFILFYFAIRYSKILRITNSSAQKYVWTANLLHARVLQFKLSYDHWNLRFFKFSNGPPGFKIFGKIYVFSNYLFQVRCWNGVLCRTRVNHVRGFGALSNIRCTNASENRTG